MPMPPKSDVRDGTIRDRVDAAPSPARRKRKPVASEEHGLTIRRSEIAKTRSASARTAGRCFGTMKQARFGKSRSYPPRRAIQDSETLMGYRANAAYWIIRF